MTDAREFGTRVDGKAYCDLPEGHRTTFVVGLADMMDLLAKHTGQEGSRLDIMRRYARPLTGGELCKLMDDYMSADTSRQQYAASSNFLAALAEKCAL